MVEHAGVARRHIAVRILIGTLAALCLALPGVPCRAGGSEDEGQPAKVAKKVEKALATARQAEGERKALRHFQEAVDEYAELHAKQLAALGAQESTATQKALGRAMRTKRAEALRGDIFRPDVQPLFRRLVREQLEGEGALDARRSIVEGNLGDDEPSVPVQVRVNAEFPTGAARSTVPPSVLLTLPPLPEALHYRFVGRDLLLVDSVAQLIVDFLPAAVPDRAGK